MKASLRHGIRLPHRRGARIALGVGLILGGLLWFLPIVGIWMLPLGVVVLSVDLPRVRRFRRRVSVRWGRARKNWKNSKNSN
jgi:hypothetical protein